MSQPPGAPPEQWAPRTDAGARKVVERLDRLADELEDVRRESVTYKALMGWIGGAACIIVMAAWVVTQSAVANAREASAEAQKAAADLRSEVVANKTIAEQGQAELRKDIGAVYQYLLTRRRQPRLDAAAGDE